MKISKQRFVIGLLVVLLVVALGYILVDKYNEKRELEQLEIFQQGVQFGYEQAVLQLMEELASCQPVPLYAENQTINAIAVECLQGQG